VDGVYYSFGPDLNIDFNDVAQVSVLKGPQGTLFGRNATGGVVSFTTRDPSHTFGGEFTTSLDSYLTTRSNLYLGGPVASNFLAGLSVSYAHQGNGWGHDLNTGKDIHRIKHDLSLRGKLIYDQGPTKITLAADYSDQANDLGLNFVPFPTIIGAKALPNPYDAANKAESLYTHKGGGVSLNINEDLGFANLVSISAYRKPTAVLHFPSGASASPLTVINFPEKSVQLTQELQLVSKKSDVFNWVFGAYFYRNRASVDNAAIQVFIPGTVLNIAQFARQTANSYAVFGQGTYSITPHTRFTAGLRYTYETVDLYGTSQGPGPATTVFSPAGISASKPTWRLAIDQDFTSTILGYASYTRGFKSGGFNTSSPSNPPYNGEKIDAYETGLKSELLDRRLRVNISAFYYKYSNIQLVRYQLVGIVSNAKGAHVYGFDADWDARITENFHLNGGFTVLHSSFLSFPNAQFTTPLPNGGALVRSGDATGNQLPFSPKFTLTAGFDYKIPTSFGDITLNVNESHNSGYYAEADNRLFQKSFDVLNASIQWRARDDRYGVRVWANNLLNEAYVNQFGSGSTGYIASYSNPPRTVGATFNLSF
jgi:outer membrane receptor protein involved in Fe transport